MTSFTGRCFRSSREAICISLSRPYSGKKGKEGPLYLLNEENLEDFILEKGIEDLRLVMPGNKNPLSGKGLLR